MLFNIKSKIFTCSSRRGQIRGGFKHHNFVTDRNVNKFYKEYKRLKNADGFKL